MIPYFIIVIILLGVIGTTTLIAIKALQLTQKDMHEEPIPVLLSLGILLLNTAAFIITIWQVLSIITEYSIIGVRSILNKQILNGFSAFTATLLIILISAFFTMTLVNYLNRKK